jgi:CheY-like chemotaxis protein
VHSAVDKGTEFRLTLPLASKPLDRKKPRTAKTDAGGSERLRGLRLLVAEDNAVSRRIIESTLSRAGAAFTLVENGRAALTALKESASPFQAVLMDIEMPVLDGYAAAREIRAAGWQVPIFAMSAHRPETIRAACLEAGMNGVLDKPFKVAALAGVLAEA